MDISFQDVTHNVKLFHFRISIRQKNHRNNSDDFLFSHLRLEYYRYTTCISGVLKQPLFNLITLPLWDQ
jgi:hypothetical protein